MANEFDTLTETLCGALARGAGERRVMGALLMMLRASYDSEAFDRDAHANTRRLLLKWSLAGAAKPGAVERLTRALDNVRAKGATLSPGRARDRARRPGTRPTTRVPRGSALDALDSMLEFALRVERGDRDPLRFAQDACARMLAPEVPLRRTWGMTGAQRVSVALVAGLPSEAGDNDYLRAAASALAPERPRGKEARAAVARAGDGAEAWEILEARGLVTADWTSSGERSFGCPTSTGALHFVNDAAVPWSVADALLYGCDVAGMRRAEALAREAATALYPWREVGAGRRPLQWRPIHRGEWLSLYEAPVPRALRVAIGREVVGDSGTGRAEPEPGTWVDVQTELTGRDYGAALAAYARPSNDPGAHDDRLPGLFAMAERWRVLVETDRRVPTAAMPGALAGRPFRALKDPFGPLVALAATGYAVVFLRDDLLALGAPPL